MNFTALTFCGALVAAGLGVLVGTTATEKWHQREIEREIAKQAAEIAPHVQPDGRIRLYVDLETGLTAIPPEYVKATGNEPTWLQTSNYVCYAWRTESSELSVPLCKDIIVQ